MNLQQKSLAIAGAAILAVGMLGAYLLGDGPSEDQVEVVAVFEDASPLVSGNVVKAAGVDVGTVSDIELENGRAHVVLELERAVLPLHEDVKATITTQDLLGERFVSLDRGSPDAPEMKEPMVINDDHTERVVALQDVLNSVDTPTSVALASLVTEAGEGLKGRGKAVDRAIAALGPAMTQTRDLAAILAEQNQLLTSLVDNVQPVAASLGKDHGRNLDHLVDSATTSLSAVAAEREHVRSSLERLPQTMSSARKTLAQLAGVAGSATDTLASLRPVTDDLGDISGELQRFADAADPALASLPKVLDRADELLAKAKPVVRVLRPTAQDLVPTAAAANQLSSGAVSGQNLTNLMEFVKGWSMATSDYDAISHYFKAMVPLSPNALGDTASGLLPALPDEILHGLPVPSAPEVPLPGRHGKTGPENAPAKPGRASPGGEKPTGGGATGLSPKQENALVEQLLGGLS